MRLGCMTFIIMMLCIALISCAKDSPDFEVIGVKNPVTEVEENESTQEAKYKDADYAQKHTRYLLII